MSFLALAGRAILAGVRAFVGAPAATTAARAVLPAARTGTAGAAAAVAARAARIAGSPAAALAAGVAGGVAGAQIVSLPHPGPVTGAAAAAVMRGGLAGGNGVVARQTLVQTVDISTGAIVRSELLPGAPFLMNSEVRSLRRVAKKVGRAHAKLPRRTVQKSAMKELTDAAVAEALRKVQQPCPPGSSHG